ncbi:MAG: hypothetical protein ABEI98_10710, partial [Halorhabdus sp.]
MTDSTPSTDKSTADSTILSRRRVLAGLGASAAVGTGGLGVLAATQSTTCSSPPGGWSAISRTKAANYSDGDGDGNEKYYEKYRPLPVATVDHLSTLDYLGSTWDPHTDPGSSGAGAWQHTFMLSTFGIAQMVDQVVDEVATHAWSNLSLAESDASILSRPATYSPASGSYDGLKPKLRVEVTDPPYDAALSGSAGRPENLGISARRDPSLFAFADPSPLLDAIESPATTAEESLDRGFDAIARNGDVGTGALPDPEVQAVASTVKNRSSLSGAAAHLNRILGLGAGILEEALDSKFFSYVGKGLGALGLAMSLPSAVGELTNGPKNVADNRLWFNQGFEKSVNQTDPICLGYVMFDVFAPPGKGGYISVNGRAKDATNGAYHVSSKQIEIQPMDRPDSLDHFLEPGEVPERYGARIVDDNSGIYSVDVENVRDTSPVSTTETPSGLGLTPVKTTDRPQPALGVDDAIASTGPIAAGTGVTFDATDTVVRRGQIDSYDWSVSHLDGAGEKTETYADPSPGDCSVFETTVEQPDATQSHVQRVELTVKDTTGATATVSRDFLVEGANYEGIRLRITEIRTDLAESIDSDTRQFHVVVETTHGAVDIERLLWKRVREKDSNKKVEVDVGNELRMYIAKETTPTFQFSVWDSLGNLFEFETDISYDEEPGIVTRQRPNTKTVTEVEPIDGSTPQDIDDDRRHEDINANGQVGFPDVNA